MFAANLFSESLLASAVVAIAGGCGACALLRLSRRASRRVARRGRRAPARCLLVGGIPLLAFSLAAAAYARAAPAPAGDSDFTPMFMLLLALAIELFFFIAGFVPSLVALASLAGWREHPYQAVVGATTGLGILFWVPYLGPAAYYAAAAWGAGAVWSALFARRPPAEK